MDSESTDSRSKGAWDPKTLLTPFFENWCSTTPTPDFLVDDVWCGMVGSLGFGAGATAHIIRFWTETLKSVYKGDEGRKKLKMSLACLLERDGLLLRVRDVVCPVYWLQVSCTGSVSPLVQSPSESNKNQGTLDAPFGTTLPAEQIKLFTSSKETVLTLVEGGSHYLNATNPREVNAALMRLVSKYKN